MFRVFFCLFLFFFFFLSFIRACVKKLISGSHYRKFCFSFTNVKSYSVDLWVKLKGERQCDDAASVWKHGDGGGCTSQSSSRGRGPLGGFGKRWGAEEAEGRQHSPRQTLLHTQVLLSAGVLLQLLAKDWFNYFHSLCPCISLILCLLYLVAFWLLSENPKVYCGQNNASYIFKWPLLDFMQIWSVF